MHLAAKARNVLRGLLQAYGTRGVKRCLWDVEFSSGRWDCLENTPGDCVYPWIEKYANQGSVLDLGCGSGSTGAELDSGTYHHYTGVDISEVAINKARQRSEQNGRASKNRFIQSDIFSYVPTERFDVILFRDSIYYIPRRRIAGMLARYAKHLNHAGVFIVRMSGESKYRAIVDTIEGHFDLVDRHEAGQPEAVVIVFRPRAARVSGSYR